MSKKSIIVLIVFFALVALAVVRFWSPEDTWLCQNGAWVKHGAPDSPKPITKCEESQPIEKENVVCTMEAKVCPDGSYVGRTGPKCEFTACPEVNSLLPESEARTIAEKTCIKGGESLSQGVYNENTKTWWYDANLNVTKEGCNPACVVSEETKTAEINWRCTGLKVSETQ